MGLQELIASEERPGANRALRVATGLPCGHEGISTGLLPGGGCPNVRPKGCL